MRRQTTLSVLLISVVGFGCRPVGDRGNNLNRGDDSPFVDATKGEKPVRCAFGACGSWRAPDEQVGQNVVQVQISFALNQFTRRVTCHYREGTMKTAQVTVRAAVTPNQIDVYQNEVARDRGPVGQPDCEARIDKTRVQYDNPDKNTLRILYNNGRSSNWEKESTKP